MDSDSFFDKIQKQYDEALPFVVYRKPNESQLKSLLQNDSRLNKNVDFTESGFVFAPFDDKEISVNIPFYSAEYIVFDKVLSSDSEVWEQKPHMLSMSPEKQKQFHINLVQKAIDKIKENEFQKVVVSRNETIILSNSDPIAIFKKLLKKYPSAFIYCWYHPKIGLWLGATPETLLKIEGNRLSTMALAGTQKFIDTEDVVWQEKEKNEQQLVTDFIVESLKSSTEGIHISETTTMKAGNLLHLKTDIKAHFKPETLKLKQMIHNLHPTPAICGLPKEKAKQFILDNEEYHRDYYSGFLGELNFKEKTSRNSNKRNVENNAYAAIKNVSNLYVNLRCMQLKGTHAIIYIGGGITKDSSPEMEWEETVSKSEVIKSVL
jgi:isochorismate synthase